VLRWQINDDDDDDDDDMVNIDCSNTDFDRNEQGDLPL